jgi:hypothetical protein
MKTLTLRIPDVEAAMLAEVQKSNKSFRDPQGLLLGLIRQEYQKLSGGKK